MRGQIIFALEAVFVKLTTQEEEFTNTGVRHKRHSNGTSRSLSNISDPDDEESAAGENIAEEDPYEEVLVPKQAGHPPPGYPRPPVLEQREPVTPGPPVLTPSGRASIQAQVTAARKK